MKYFVYLVIAVVVAAVVAGFFVVGSPQEERLRKLDERRVGDLQFIQGQVVNFWQNKGRLPNNLAELEDDIRGTRVPTDPETGLAYGYEARGPETLALCATFALANLSEKAASRYANPYYEYDESWVHGEGIMCFERTIDKDIYEPRPLPKPIPPNQ